MRHDELAQELEDEVLLDLPYFLWMSRGGVLKTREAGPDDLHLAAADEEHKAAWATTWEDRFERMSRVWALRWLAERRS